MLTGNGIRELQVVEPDAVVLTRSENSDMDTASSDAETKGHPDIPEPLTVLFDPAIRKHSPEKMQFKILKMKLPHQSEKLEFVTQ